MNIFKLAVLLADVLGLHACTALLWCLHGTEPQHDMPFRRFRRVLAQLPRNVTPAYNLSYEGLAESLGAVMGTCAMNQNVTLRPISVALQDSIR